MENSVTKEMRQSIIHIADYVIRKTNTTHEEDTYDYFQKYDEYTESLNRGGLSTPSDNACQCTGFGTIMFEFIKKKVCEHLFLKFSARYQTSTSLTCFNLTAKY